MNGLSRGKLLLFSAIPALLLLLVALGSAEVWLRYRYRNVASITGMNEWRSGGLLGDKPEKAYFVKCDCSTMSQNDLDNGRLICHIGVALSRPAEFVIFRIGQFGDLDLTASSFGDGTIMNTEDRTWIEPQKGIAPDRFAAFNRFEQKRSMGQLPGPAAVRTTRRTLK